VDGVPLESHSTLIGFLTLDSRQVGVFGKAQTPLVQAFANQAAVAIENARLFSEVQRLAVTDPLTGLYNRRGFYELARREIERARRFKRESSAIMLDIDHFKKINDTYKHAAGDVVLRMIAEVCMHETATTSSGVMGRRSCCCCQKPA
jgi:GGDEF domain-containing protein